MAENNKLFNFQEFTIQRDFSGERFTNESLLFGIVNHMQLSGTTGYGGFSGEIVGDLEGLSINCLAFTMSNEGWSDAKSRGFMGKIMTNATAGCQSSIDSAGVITVGPGLTNYLNGSLPDDLKIIDGKTYTPEMIGRIYKICHAGHAAAVKKYIPAITTFGTQGCWDACIDAAHSGHGFLKKYMGGATSRQQLADMVMNMPTSSKQAGKLAALEERRVMERAMILGTSPTGLSANAQARWNNYMNPPEDVKRFASLLASI